MSSAEDPGVERKGASVALTILWIIAGVGALYFGVFILLYLDEVAFRTRWFQNSLKEISPAFESQIGDAFRVVYFPLLYAMRVMKLIPLS